MAQSSKKRVTPAAKRSTRKGEALQADRQTKKQIALSKKHARQRRVIWLSLAALGVVIVGIIIAGLLQEFVFNPARPVAIVNGAKARIDDYQDLVIYRRYNLHRSSLDLQAALSSLAADEEGNEFLISFYEQQLQQLQSSLELIPETSLEELIEDKLIQEKAAEENIAVTNDEVEQTINDQLHQAAAPLPQTSITNTEEVATATPVPQEQLDTLYESALSNMGLSDKSFRAIMQRGMLREKVQELLASQVVTTGLVIKAQLIKTDTQEQADAALARIEAGEEFGLVAQEVSTDTLTAEEGGDLGWVTTGQLSLRYGEDLENAVFAPSPGEIQQLESDGAFYVIQVVDRDENGPLPEEVVVQRQNSALNDWLAERKEAPDVVIERLLEPDQIPEDPFASLSTLPSSSSP